MNDPEHLHQNIFYSIIDGVLLISSSLTIQESNLTVEAVSYTHLTLPTICSV